MSAITINILPDDFKPLPIYLHTVCDSFPQPTTKRPDGHPDFYQILIVISGTGILNCEGETYLLKRGCAFFTATDVPSEYINTGGLVSAFLTVKGEMLPIIMEHYGIKKFLFCESVNIEKCISDINNMIREYYQYKRQGVLSAMAYSFYTNFFEQQHGGDFSIPEKTALFIEKNYMDKLTLAYLAKQNGISVSKLCSDFKKKFGYTIFQYILNLRLTHSRNHLFSNPDCSVKDAALSCGFDDVSYFCKAYRKKFGRSPSKDREQI